MPTLSLTHFGWCLPSQVMQVHFLWTSLNPFFSCLLLDLSPVFNTLGHFFTEAQSGLSLVFRTEGSPVFLLSPWLLLAPLCPHLALSGHPGDAQGSCALDPSSSHATFSLQGIHHDLSLVSVAISWSLSNVCLSSGLQTCGSDFLPDIPTCMSQRSQKLSIFKSEYVKVNWSEYEYDHKQCHPQIWTTDVLPWFTDFRGPPLSQTAFMRQTWAPLSLGIRPSVLAQHTLKPRTSAHY